MPGTFLSCVMATILFGFAFSLAMPCEAEPADDAEFAALRADAKKSFLEGVTPFVNTALRVLEWVNFEGGTDF